jgi:hypothetical protein
VSESFIYFLWQYQYFDHSSLTSTDGESIQVIHPGFRNANAGPDFTNSRLLINDIEWFGTVEIHIKAGDWLAHRHQHDRSYDNVILHLVWEADKLIYRTDGSVIPTLELQSRTADNLLYRYQALTDSTDTIPCAGNWASVHSLKIVSMLDKALLQRLERKAATVQLIFEATTLDWEETAYQLLAINLGFKINAEPMAQLSRALPLKILHKHRNSLLQVEAMLFGTAGLLAELSEADEYTEQLQREYRFLAAKYGLVDKQLPTHIWKWGRLRPANFPTLRIAQLAKLITVTPSLFSLFADSLGVEQLTRELQVTPSPYWQHHYRFGKTTLKAAPTLGQSSANSILVNTVVPVLAAYAHHRALPGYIDRAIAFLEQLPPETNHITDVWQQIGLAMKSAFDSQAAIELYNEFCLPKHCLNCQIGAHLVGYKA